MKRVYRLIKCRTNIRRLLALGFVLIVFVEVGSHAIQDSQDPNGKTMAAWCKVLHKLSPSADCPHKRHDTLPSSNPFGDVTHYWMTLGDLTFPLKVVVHETPLTTRSNATALTRALAPPFIPPKQA